MPVSKAWQKPHAALSSMAVTGRAPFSVERQLAAAPRGGHMLVPPLTCMCYGRPATPLPIWRGIRPACPICSSPSSTPSISWCRSPPQQPCPLPAPLCLLLFNSCRVNPNQCFIMSLSLKQGALPLNASSTGGRLAHASPPPPWCHTAYPPMCAQVHPAGAPSLTSLCSFNMIAQTSQSII